MKKRDQDYLYSLIVDISHYLKNGELLYCRDIDKFAPLIEGWFKQDY